jgi:hypothetical protein
MTIIAEKISEIQRVQNYAIVAARFAIIESSEFIEELNRQQLSEGQRSDGSTLPDYSPTSVNLFGKQPGPIKLFDEGDFYDGINVNVFDDEFRLDGEDEKTSMLIARYGDMILGLTEENKQVLIDYIRPIIINLMKTFYKSV